MVCATRSRAFALRGPVSRAEPLVGYFRLDRPMRRVPFELVAVLVGDRDEKRHRIAGREPEIDERDRELENAACRNHRTASAALNPVRLARAMIPEPSRQPAE